MVADLSNAVMVSILSTCMLLPKKRVVMLVTFLRFVTATVKQQADTAGSMPKF